MKYYLATVAVGALLVLSFYLGPRMGVGAPGSDRSSPAAAVATQRLKIFESNDDLALYMTWKAQVLSDYAANGVAAGDAEFHLLRPGTDPAFREGRFSNAPHSSGWHDFWSITPRYQAGYTFPDSAGLFPSTVQVGIGDLFSSRWVASATAVLDGGTYRVDLEFGQSAVQHFATLIDSEDDYSQLDWFGLKPAPGGGDTEMKAVVVADNIAYRPFSVTSIVQGNLYDTPITVADELTQAEADLLVDRLAP
jgi:hypothetical protein